MTGELRGRCAVGSYAYLHYTTDYFLDTAKALGFDKVELWAAAPQIDLLGLTPSVCRSLKEKLSSRGLSVCAITPEQLAYPINLAGDDAPLRRRSIDYYKNGIELAAALQSPYLLLTAGSGYYDQPPEAAWERSVDSIGQLALFAGARGVRLLLETLTPGSSNIVNTPAQVRRMMDALPRGAVFGMLDIGQMTVMGQSVAEYGMALGDKLAHVHLHDTGAACHMALGEGELALEKIIGQILTWGYEGIFSLECNDARYRKNPRAADEKNAAWLRQAGFL